MGWKGVGRTVLRWGIWVLLGWVLVRGVVSLLPAPPVQSAAPEAGKLPVATEPPGLRALPAMFAREYLTWLPANPDERAERLRPYLARSLDRQAGWTGKEGVGQTAEAAWVYAVKQVSQTRWLVTVAARVRPQAPPPAQAPPAPAQPERTLFLAVPVSTTPEGGWTVYDYPSIIPAPVAGEVTEPLFYGQESTDKDDKVKTLLTGFFKAYFEGGDLTYYLAPGSTSAKLQGGWQFGQVSKVIVTASGGDTWALADVVATDTASGARFTSRYTTGLVDRDGRWYIKELLQRGE
jgi:hypothetical protein